MKTKLDLNLAALDLVRAQTDLANDPGLDAAIAAAGAKLKLTGSDYQYFKTTATQICHQFKSLAAQPTAEALAAAKAKPPEKK